MSKVTSTLALITLLFTSCDSTPSSPPVQTPITAQVKATIHPLEALKQASNFCTQKLYEQALEGCFQISDLDVRGRCMFEVGWCLQKSGQPDFALRAAREVKTDYLNVNLLGRVGIDFIKLGEREKGMPIVQEALALAERLRAIEMRPHTLAYLAEGLYEVKEFDRAKAAVDRAVAFAVTYNTANPRYGTAELALQTVAQAQVVLKNYDSATELLQKITNPCEHLPVLFDMADALRTDGEMVRANQTFHHALEIVTTARDCHVGKSSDDFLETIAARFSVARTPEWYQEILALMTTPPVNPADLDPALLGKAQEIAKAAATGLDMPDLDVVHQKRNFKATGTTSQSQNIERFIRALESRTEIGRVELDFAKQVMDGAQKRQAFSIIFECK